jgi:hypothetical protein
MKVILIIHFDLNFFIIKPCVQCNWCFDVDPLISHNFFTRRTFRFLMVEILEILQNLSYLSMNRLLDNFTIILFYCMR